MEAQMPPVASAPSHPPVVARRRSNDRVRPSVRIPTARKRGIHAESGRDACIPGAPESGAPFRPPRCKAKLRRGHRNNPVAAGSFPAVNGTRQPVSPGRHMMPIVRNIDVTMQSEVSFDDACRAAVAEAARTLRGIMSFRIKEAECVVEHDKIIAFRVTGKVVFLVER
jgi:hypothetical protein